MMAHQQRVHRLRHVLRVLKDNLLSKVYVFFGSFIGWVFFPRVFF